jgi:hypothetical protein
MCGHDGESGGVSSHSSSHGSEALRMSAEKKAYPLRIGTDVLQAMQRWADDELRSVNAQIEYVLRNALRERGRLNKPDDEPKPE